MTNLNKSIPPHNVPRFETVLITPARAAELLAHDGPKRAISALYVNKLARMIISGEWCATHQTIALDVNGCLVDGHHRCSAIVKANKAAWVVVATYPGEVPVGTFDQGAKRTAGHTLEMKGLMPAGQGGKYESLARALHIGLGQRHGMQLGPGEVERVVARFRSEFDWAVKGQKKYLLAPHLAAFAYVFPLYPQQIGDAVQSISRGANLIYRSPLWLLSQDLQKNTSRRMGYHEYPDAFLRALRVIDAHLLGRSMKILKGSIDQSESTPKIIVEWQRRRQMANLPYETLLSSCRDLSNTTSLFSETRCRRRSEYRVSEKS